LFYGSNKVTFPGFSVAHNKRSVTTKMTSQKNFFFPELPGHKNFVAFCGVLPFWGVLGLFVAFCGMWLFGAFCGVLLRLSF
jgi:hypothetical protein